MLYLIGFEDFPCHFSFGCKRPERMHSVMRVACVQVEMRKFWAALLELQVPNVDMLLLFRTAAHDVAHDDLFVSVQAMCL